MATKKKAAKGDAFVPWVDVKKKLPHRPLNKARALTSVAELLVNRKRFFRFMDKT